MRARWIPHLVAAGITVPFGIWIAVSDIRGVLPPAAWLLPLAAAYYLGLRIGREVVRGVRRAGDEEAGSGTMFGGADDAGEDDDEAAADRPLSLKRDREGR